MSTFTVALLQMVPEGSDRDANLAIGERYCREARERGADLALFPEMWSNGYVGFAPPADAASDLWRAPGRWTTPASPPDPDLERRRRAWQAQAISRDDPFVRHFQALARELQMAIGITYLERWPGAPRNTVSIVDRHGAIGLTYAKVHTCDFDHHEASLTSGDAFPVCTLDTAAGPVQLGAMICYDREFPESARILMLNGAEVILVPNACPLEANRLGQFRARAYENMVGVAMANYAAPTINGHSCAFDPIAFDPDDPAAGEDGSRDTCIVMAGPEPGVYLAPFDLDRLRAYREAETWGNAFRRPHRYGAPADVTIRPPFLRVDAAGTPYDPP